MKKISLFSMTIALLACGIIASAQHHSLPFAVSKSGMIFGNHQTIYHSESMHSIIHLPDTISLEDAKSIYALKIIYLGDKKEPLVVGAVKYTIAIYNDSGRTDEKTFNGEYLPEAAKSFISTLKSGDRFSFTWINDGVMDVVRTNMLALQIK